MFWTVITAHLLPDHQGVSVMDAQTNNTKTLLSHEHVKLSWDVAFGTCFSVRTLTQMHLLMKLLPLLPKKHASFSSRKRVFTLSLDRVARSVAVFFVDAAWHSCSKDMSDSSAPAARKRTLHNWSKQQQWTSQRKHICNVFTKKQRNT